jgi:transcriptional regulator with XRE-family HTH domain
MIEAAMDISPLGEFVYFRRKSLKMSRDEVAASAKRHGLRLSASYVAKLENGDPGTGRSPSPTREKMDALAAALNTTRQLLLDLLDGSARVTTELMGDAQSYGIEYIDEVGVFDENLEYEGAPEIEPRAHQQPTALHLLQGGKHTHPLTDREEATLREAESLSIQAHAPFTDPGFMNREPEDEIREEAFMLLRQLVRNTKQSRGMR